MDGAVGGTATVRVVFWNGALVGENVVDPVVHGTTTKTGVRLVGRVVAVVVVGCREGRVVMTGAAVTGALVVTVTAVDTVVPVGVTGANKMGDLVMGATVGVNVAPSMV